MNIIVLINKYLLPYLHLLIILDCLVNAIIKISIPRIFLNFKRKLLRTLHLITQQKATATIPKKKITRIRIFGILYLVTAISLLILLDFDISIWDKENIPIYSNNTSKSIHNDVESEMKSFLTEKTIPGLVIGVIYKDSSNVSGFGRTNNNSIYPPNENTIFEIGSISKVFTGTILAKAILNGKIALNNPLDKYLPADIQEKNLYLEQIKISNLTTHTSGLARLPIGLNYPSVQSTVSVLLMGNPYKYFNETYIYSHLTKVKPKTEIGTFAYSNFAVGVLGLILSNIYDLEYDEMLFSEICEPYNLIDTKMYVSGNQEKRMAQGYGSFFRIGKLAVALKSSNWDMTNALSGAGGIKSSAKDLLKFLEINMNVRDSTVQISQAEIFRKNKFNAIGMGWFRINNFSKDKTVIWHNGGTGGFRSFLGFIEKERIGIVILSNGNKFVDKLGFDLLRKLVQKNKMKKEKDTITYNNDIQRSSFASR